jgi:hypothetical protein
MGTCAIVRMLMAELLMQMALLPTYTNASSMLRPTNLFGIPDANTRQAK